MPKNHQILPLKLNHSGKLNFRVKHRYWLFAKDYPVHFANFLHRKSFSPNISQKWLIHQRATRIG